MQRRLRDRTFGRFMEHWPVTDRRTDRRTYKRTDAGPQHIPR